MCSRLESRLLGETLARVLRFHNLGFLLSLAFVKGLQLARGSQVTLVLLTRQARPRRSLSLQLVRNLHLADVSLLLTFDLVNLVVGDRAVLVISIVLG